MPDPTSSESAALASMEQELERLRERMELLSAASFEGLFFHIDGSIIDVNQRLVELGGYDAEEMLGDQFLRRCVVPEDVPTVVGNIAKGYEGSYVITAVRKDGSRFLAELQTKQGKLGNRPVRVVAVRDVTERERTAALLRESETRLRELAQATFDITVFSRDGVIVDLVGDPAKVFGYVREEMIGHPVLEFVSPSVAADIGQAIKQGKGGVFESVAIAKSGEPIPMEVVAVHTTLHGQPVRMSAVRDLRAARRAEDERRELSRAFERSQRLDSLGVLAGGIAHDFNNLLTIVLGHAHLLRRRLEAPHERELVQGILDAGERAASLTAQMLAYAGRKEIGPRTPVDLGTLAQELSALLDSTLSKKAKVKLAIEPGSVVLGNRATLAQVLLNLLINASDALAGEAGEIDVRTRTLHAPEPRFARALGVQLAPGPLILLEVADTGVGMDAATLERIFEPFFSTKEQGHGLGLAACIGIVTSHGGSILVESTVGKGSCFSVLLPGYEHAPQADAEPRASSIVVQRRALVVDDEPALLAHVSRVLREHGYDVTEAKDGRSALAAIERAEPSVVLLDVTMPELSGVEVLSRIRGSGSNVAVVLSSGYHDAALELDPRSFQGFLVKPYTPAELLEALERALSER